MVFTHNKLYVITIHVISECSNMLLGSLIQLFLISFLNRFLFVFYRNHSMKREYPFVKIIMVIYQCLYLTTGKSLSLFEYTNLFFFSRFMQTLRMFFDLAVIKLILMKVTIHNMFLKLINFRHK